MSTLPLRATPAALPLPGLARLAAYFSFFFEVYGEAKAQMRAANEKYPYAGI
jgi:hypothetical protein